MVVEMVGMRQVVVEQEDDQDEDGGDGGVGEGRTGFHHHCSWF